MTNRTMTAGDWTLLAVLSVLWGGSFFFVEVAIEQWPPATVVTGRVGLAAIALWVWVAASGLPVPRDFRVWGAFAAMGALNNVLPFGLIAWGQTAIDSGLASILNATTPLFTVVIAHVVTADERMTANRLAGVVIGIVGVAVLVGPAALTGIGGHALGQVAILAAALSYACAGVYGRRLSAMPPAVAAAGMLTASTVMSVPFALVLDRPWTLAIDGITVGAVVGLALASTAVAYLIYFRLLARAGATNLLLVTFLIPVTALVLGILVLGERPGVSAFAGMALIFAGLAAVDGRLLAWFARRRRPGVRTAR